MGIINVTPDSFSDGGRFLEPQAAVEHGLRLAAEGAAILDVGGQSTRPGSAPLGEEEELRRVMPVILALAHRTPIPISIDTSKAAVARRAVAAGAQIINDVTALESDPEMVRVAVDSGAGVCIMHMQGTPLSMQRKPTYTNVVEEVIEFLERRRDTLVSAGIAAHRIAVDPGIGFGKNLQHNLRLLSQARQLHRLGCPVVVGHSRKRFIGQVLRDEQADRTIGSIGAALSLASQGIQILRVHDVAEVRQAMLLYQATGGLP
jgi:dihydropteroate synthase